MPELTMSDSAAQPVLSEDIARFNKDLYKSHSTCVFVDVIGTRPSQDSEKSYYNVRTAIVTMNDVCKRVQQFSGSQITVITPYKAQLWLHEKLCEATINMH